VHCQFSLSVSELPFSTHSEAQKSSSLSNTASGTPRTAHSQTTVTRQPQTRPFLAQLHGRLVAEKFTFERSEMPCHPSVIEHLLENARTHMDTESHTDDNEHAQSRVV
jgi:hypothetical protein